MSVLQTDLGNINIQIDDLECNHKQPTVLTEIDKRNKIEEYLQRVYSITYYLKNIKEDCEDETHKYYLVSLLEDMLPNYEQAIKMFNSNNK